MKTKADHFDRELSWLSFNQRVLQEAQNPDVPLMDRLRYLAIFSSNLEEFFIVRVASLRSLKALKKKERKSLDLKLNKLLKQILKRVIQLQEEFGLVYRESILPELEKHGVHLVNDQTIPSFVMKKTKKFFKNEIQPNVSPINLEESEVPFLNHRKIYLVVAFEEQNEKDGYGLIEIPSETMGRFHNFKKQGKHYVLFLEDIIRLYCQELFPDRVALHSHSISVSRDAELYLEDEFSGDMLEKIQKSLAKRKTGRPSRMLYDAKMPGDMLDMLKDKFQIDDDEAVAGYRYHHFNDFFGFPNPDGLIPEFKPLELVPHLPLQESETLFELIAQKDQLLHFPYHSYDPVIRFLELASTDRFVTEIRITLYRVSSDSKVVKALLQAVENGKKVFVFIEVKARFDETSNIQQVEQLQQAGATVLYDLPNLKVHSKICHISRSENGKDRAYCFLSTGNFNEKTSRIYTDMGLFTAEHGITDDVLNVFGQLETGVVQTQGQDLLVAPNYLRNNLYSLIDQEIENSKRGLDSFIKMKMNNLEDIDMIEKLYEASQAGVKVEMIVRGICKLIPGVEGLSENISVVSIVGRFLEHSRVFIFHQLGKNKIYVGSADLMKRNLSHRIEVVFPINAPNLKEEVETIIKLQLNDNVKSRLVDENQQNIYRTTDSNPLNAQMEIHQYLMSIHAPKTSA